MNFYLRFCLIIPYICLSLSAFAANERPFSGYIGDKKSRSAIAYRCHDINKSEIECDISTVSVRPAMTEEDVIKNIEADKKNFQETPDKFAGEMRFWCERSKFQPKNDAPESSKTFWKRANSLYAKACAEPTLDTMLAITRFMGDDAKKRCKINTDTSITKSFRLTPEGTWAASTDRTSACNVITIERFEKAEGDTWWSFISKTISAGPQPDIIGCKYLADEIEYRYRWDTKSFPMLCEEIEFGL